MDDGKRGDQLPLLTINALGLAPGGGLTYAVNQLPLLVDRLVGWRVRILASPRSATALSGVISDTNDQASELVVPFSGQPSSLYRMWWEQYDLPSRLMDDGTDVVYHMGGFGTLRRTVPQVVLHHNPNHYGRSVFHDGPIRVARSTAERFLSRVTCRRADIAIAVSRSHAEELQQRGYPVDLMVIESGVSQDIGVASREADLAAMKIMSSRFALAIHNWYRHKDLPWLVSQWPAVLSRTGLALVLVGSPVDSRTARLVRQEVTRSKGSVTLVSGIDRPIVNALLQRADLYVSASRLEAFPLTPLEAMESRTPCVLSNIASHREVAGNAAEFFWRNDGGSLRNACTRALESSHILAEKGVQRSRQYTWESNATQIAGVIRAVVGSIPQL